MGTPGNSGLKGQWGVGNPSGPQSPQNAAPQDTGSDEQARQFQAAFQSIQAEINGHLQYTSTNAEASKNATFTSRRDALYSAFQSALGKIDRNDPSKAQGDIDRVLGDARALSGEVGTFRQETEQAKAEWDSSQASFDEAVQQVEELEAWEDPQASGLRGQADEIRTHANERRWREACTALDGLLPAVQPVYAEYLKQKTAQEAFEPALEALQPRLQAVSVSDPAYATLAPMVDELATAQTQMEASVQAKDYVQAQAQLQDLSAKVDALEESRAQVDQKKEAYESALAALQPRLAVASVSDPAYPELEPMQAELAQVQTEMESAAQAGDYERAESLVADLSAKVDAYEQARSDLDAQRKQEFETEWGPVQAKVAEANLTANRFKALDADLAALKAAQGGVDKAAQSGQYEDARKAIPDVNTKADAYLAAAKTKQEAATKKGEEIAKQLDGASDATRADVAKAAAAALTEEEVKALPSDVRNRLLDEMSKDGLSEGEKGAIKNLFSQRALDPAFEKLDTQRREEMIEKLKNDPELKEARKNWATMSEAQRIAALKKVADAQAAAYGIPLTDVEAYSPKNADGTNDTSLNGEYDHTDGKLKISREMMQNKGFDKALNTLVHENGHRYQATLVEKLKKTPPELKPGDPEYEQARTFMRNDDYYIQPKDDPADAPTPDTGDEYFTQPEEAHSRETGEAVQRAGIGK